MNNEARRELRAARRDESGGRARDAGEGGCGGVEGLARDVCVRLATPPTGRSARGESNSERSRRSRQLFCTARCESRKRRSRLAPPGLHFSLVPLFDGTPPCDCLRIGIRDAFFFPFPFSPEFAAETRAMVFIISAVEDARGLAPARHFARDGFVVAHAPVVRLRAGVTRPPRRANRGAHHPRPRARRARASRGRVARRLRRDVLPRACPFRAS